VSENDFETPQLRISGPDAAAGGDARAPLGAGFPINEAAELAADLLAATELLPADTLALVRGRARQTGSLARALADEGIATGDGIARMLAARHHMPLVDLTLSGVDLTAANLLPLHVLERVGAMPYAFRGDTLLIAVADPANLHGIDELRLATRHPVELGVATREDIAAAIRRLVRASEAYGARAALAEEEEALDAAED